MRGLFDFGVFFHERASSFLLCGVCREYWFLRFYLLVFLTLLTLFSYCAPLVGSSTWIVLQLVQDLMEPKPIAEFHTINLGILIMSVQISICLELNSLSTLHSTWFLLNNLFGSFSWKSLTFSKILIFQSQRVWRTFNGITAGRTAGSTTATALAATGAAARYLTNFTFFSSVDAISHNKHKHSAQTIVPLKHWTKSSSILSLTAPLSIHCSTISIIFRALKASLLHKLTLINKQPLFTVKSPCARIDHVIWITWMDVSSDTAKLVN